MGLFIAFIFSHSTTQGSRTKLNYIFYTTGVGEVCQKFRWI